MCLLTGSGKTGQASFSCRVCGGIHRSAMCARLRQAERKLPLLVRRCARDFDVQGPQSTGSRGGSECSVCLEGYQDCSRVTVLPCSHNFHTQCIEPWLRQQGMSATCPLCKRIVFGTS